MHRNRIVFFTIALLTAACGDRDSVNPDPILSYPMEVGTEWVYSREFIINYYESEASDRITGWDSSRQEIRVWIEKDTVLQDTIQLLQFISLDPVSLENSKEYYRVEKQGLTKYAYENPGMIVFAKKSSTVPAAFFNAVLSNILSMPDAAGADLYFYSTPRLSLKLPLERNSKWAYLNPSGPGSAQIDKEVTGTSRVKIPGGSFDCFRITYTYTNVSPEFVQATRNDWVSKEGLIKRQIRTEKIPLASGIGNTVYCSIIETLMLTEFNLPE
jgi:hypothetical protein